MTPNVFCVPYLKKNILYFEFYVGNSKLRHHAAKGADYIFD